MGAHTRDSRPPRGPRRGAGPPVHIDGFEPNWTALAPTWEDMGLSDGLLRGIYSYGFRVPSEIQQLAIKPITDGRHMIAQAQSGTGKTGAFAIGILQNIDPRLRETQALILAPTRELADQIYTFAKEVSHRMGITAELFIGGHRIEEDQRKAQARPHLAVGSPGRVRQMVAEGYLRSSEIRMVCLDEADELFKDDFADDIRGIFQFCPPGTQPLFFSATVSEASFAQMIQVVTDPVKILVAEEKLTLEGITQYFVNVEQDANKTECLLDLYGRLPIQKCILFVNERRTAEFFYEALNGKDWPVGVIHADLQQSEREKTMREFRHGTIRVLIGTDLIARGIDVQQVTLVMNLQLPRERAKYLHRVGRSGRYGRKGVVINIINEVELSVLGEYRRFYHTVINELDDNFVQAVKEANATAG